MSKQDRQGVRTPSDIERKYDLGKLNAFRGDSQKQDLVLTELTQKVDQFIANTNGNIEGINAEIDVINEKVDNIGTTVSPTVDVTEIDGGHRVTITDANGTETFDVMNGKDGTDGTDITSESVINALGFTPAPSGFGLGEKNAKLVADCNAAVLPGFYGSLSENLVNYPAEYMGFRYGSLLVNRRYSTVVQTITQGGIIAHRYGTTADGGATWTFNPWEYENPPMNTNVEYRTTERYGGGVVYVKRINFGKLPNNAEKVYEFGADLTIVSIDGRTINGKYMIPLSIHNGIDSVYYNDENGQLIISTKSDASAWSADLVVKYMK